jgi:hypothetical protein
MASFRLVIWSFNVLAGIKRFEDEGTVTARVDVAEVGLLKSVRPIGTGQAKIRVPARTFFEVRYRLTATDACGRRHH